MRRGVGVIVENGVYTAARITGFHLLTAPKRRRRIGSRVKAEAATVVPTAVSASGEHTYTAISLDLGGPRGLCRAAMNAGD